MSVVNVFVVRLNLQFGVTATATTTPATGQRHNLRLQSGNLSQQLVNQRLIIVRIHLSKNRHRHQSQQQRPEHQIFFHLVLR